MQWLRPKEAALVLGQSSIIAYPTESIYGLGCDPYSESAVRTLCLLKQRPLDKGLILVAASVEQILPWIQEDTLTKNQWERVLSTWPGPYTWVFPAAEMVPPWIRGAYPSVALRVSAHPIVSALCLEFGSPLVSTSANLTGTPPLQDPVEVWQEFQGHIVGIVEGSLGTQLQPSTIRDACSGKVFRG